MLSLRPFKSRAPGLADLLNWANLIDPGIVLCKDGSLLAGWFYRGPDLASSTDEERNWISARINAALSRFDGGWATWVIASRVPASGYPAPELSHFPDAVSKLIEDERRKRFLAVGMHYETEWALIVQYTPPLRRRAKIADLIYDDDSPDRSPAGKILEQFKKTLADVEDAVGDAVRLRRMEAFRATDRRGSLQQRDELVDFLHFCLTGEIVSLNIPPAGAYLDAIIGGREFWPGHTPIIGSQTDGHFIACVAIEGFPAETTPNLLSVLDDLALPYRWSSRMIFTDRHEALASLQKYRRVWKQKQRGFFAQLFKLQTGPADADAVRAVHQIDAALGEANSGSVAFGYYTPVIVLMAPSRDEAIEGARLIAREVQRDGFVARIETENAVEAWLSTLPGHVVPNVRRPLAHTRTLADLLPLSSVWTGREFNPCPFYPEGSPPLLHAATAGATPYRLNLHVSDVGHTLIFGPTGAGKSTLLCTIALQALRYAGVTITAFDKGRSMLATLLACGGRHYDIGGDECAPAFCPLSVLDTDADLAWAEDWASISFELQAGSVRTPTQRDAIHRALELLRAPGSERTLTHFVAQIQNEIVREALRFYTLEGPLGRLLDAEHDGITESRFSGFEIGELMGMGERSLIPVLLYLFRRFERSLRGQPAYLLLDEAWVMLGHPAFRASFRNG
jgi:type IV secretion system protein VirB4